MLDWSLSTDQPNHRAKLEFQHRLVMTVSSCFLALKLTALLQAKIERKRSKRATSQEPDTSTAPATAQKTVLDLAFAMGMYDLTDSELFCEVKRDTRCLMGWNDSTIVLSFRGTASMTNALSDLQVSYLSLLSAGCASQQKLGRLACCADAVICMQLCELCGLCKSLTNINCVTMVMCHALVAAAVAAICCCCILLMRLCLWDALMNVLMVYTRHKMPVMFAHGSMPMVQAWRVAHPPVRGHNWMFSRPLVHVGFLQSWLAGAFNDKVVNRTMEVVNSRKPASGKLQILITGRLSLLAFNRPFQEPVLPVSGSYSQCHEQDIVLRLMHPDQDMLLHIA